MMSRDAIHNTEVRKVTAVREPAREFTDNELAHVIGGLEHETLHAATTSTFTPNSERWIELIARGMFPGGL
jgi:pyocin large subunit-like protein